MFIVYDFEVFKEDWLVCLLELDLETRCETRLDIINNPEALRECYNLHQNDIWVGFNSRHYDQYVLKAILCGFNPKELNDHIIVEGKPGWTYETRFLRNYPFINYDVMPNPPVGLKTLEGFMGSDIEETSVPFDIDRPLTEAEIELTLRYCRHDVEQTAKVFMERINEFKAQLGIVRAFSLPLRDLGLTEARVTAKVLECDKNKVEMDDEFQYEFLPCINVRNYFSVKSWFNNVGTQVRCNGDTGSLEENRNLIKREIYSKKVPKIIAGVPHVFGFGGLHGAPTKPIHEKGNILHIDVASYYPSLLIAHDLVSRSSKTPEKYKEIYDTRMSLKRAGKKAEQAPYKKLLNALSGAMKDKYNPAYDPRRNNEMCINGQLMLLDLIEHLERVPGFKLIQTNTDGLIVKYHPKYYDRLMGVVHDWESRMSTDECEIKLEVDEIDEIWQKDVNNYIWVKGDIVERKGTYAKNLSKLDYDLPIVNEALVNYLVKKIPIEKTIGECRELIKFQKIVKLSNKFDRVEWENGDTESYRRTPNSKPRIRYTHRDVFTNKCYRVFASNNPRHGRILKCKGGKRNKFELTSEHSIIVNGNVVGVETPNWLDRDWYITLAKERLEDYGESV